MPLVFGGGAYGRKPFAAFDREPPVLSASPSETAWTNSPVTVQVISKDTQSGPAVLQYAWSESTSKPSSWTSITSTGETVVSNWEGIKYLHLRAVDRAGNRVLKTYGPFKVDLTKPTKPENITFQPLSPTTYRIAWLPATDALSGLAGYRVLVGTSPGQGDLFNELVQDTSQVIPYTWNTKYYITVAAVDLAGNTAEATAVYKPGYTVLDSAVHKIAHKIIRRATTTRSFEHAILPIGHELTRQATSGRLLEIAIKPIKVELVLPAIYISAWYDKRLKVLDLMERLTEAGILIRPRELVVAERPRELAVIDERSLIEIIERQRETHVEVL